jgi:hypothetical protein
MRVVPWGHILIALLCGAAVFGITAALTLTLRDKNPIQPMTIGLCGAIGVAGVVYRFLRIFNQ